MFAEEVTTGEAAIEMRRTMEAERLLRIKDPKSRIMGIDTEALASQVAEKQAATAAEKAIGLEYDTQRLQQDAQLAYLDLNPEQALRDNTVAALTERIALQNEPYYHEYLAFDMAAGMEEAGFVDVAPSWVNPEKNKAAIDCSLRILVATKPAEQRR